MLTSKSLTSLVDLPTSPCLSIVSVKSSSAFLSLPGHERTKRFIERGTKKSSQSWTWWLFKWIVIISTIVAVLKVYAVYTSGPRGRGGTFDLRKYNPNKRF